jgi:ElaA protein
MKIEWKISPFESLSTEELYAILKLRQHVFVVEQHCVYQDCDGRDRNAHHLAGWLNMGEKSEPIAYLRIIPPQKEGQTLLIGRVVTHPDFRGKGLGKEIMTRCLRSIEERYPKSPVRISAQSYLANFYEYFAFRISSDEYLEDGIPHIEMTLNPRT